MKVVGAGPDSVIPSPWRPDQVVVVVLDAAPGVVPDVLPDVPLMPKAARI